MTDDLALPAFLDRRLNGIVAEQSAPSRVRDHVQKYVWGKKRNWAKIVQRRREQEKREGAALLAGSIRVRKGQ